MRISYEEMQTIKAIYDQVSTKLSWGTVGNLLTSEIHNGKFKFAYSDALWTADIPISEKEELFNTEWFKFKRELLGRGYKLTVSGIIDSKLVITINKIPSYL